jgi:hypothetical protein
MSVFRNAKHCTKQIPCRYKLATMAICAAIIVYAVTVPLISELA